MKQKFYERISPEALLVAGLLLLNIFFVIFRFFPTIRDINLWDDAGYINRGRMLVEGSFPKFSDNPLMALLFALSYLPFQQDPFWMIHTATIGRLLMFALIWLSTYLIAKQVPGLKWYILVGLMFVSMILVDILENPSDAFFAGLSGLAFWQMLSFYNTRRTKNLALTSLFLGLAALARNDGLVLFGIFFLISLVYAKSAENKLQHIAASLLPFLILVGGYVLLYGLFTGDYDMGTQERSYLAFRQGQMELTTPDKNCILGTIKCAGNEVDRLYGSSAENGNSIFRAIMHNPKAYLERLEKTISQLPRLLHDTYSKEMFYPLVFLILLGIIALIRAKKYALLLISLAWVAYLGTYFLTFFRTGYLRMPFFIFFMLAGFGIQELIESIGEKRQWVWMAILLVLSGLGLWLASNYFYFGTITLLAYLLLGYWLKRNNSGMMDRPELPLTLLLAVGLILRGGFTPPVIPTIGILPEEQAILVMEKQLPRNSSVAAGAPGIPWEARMTFVTFADKDFLTEVSPDAYHAKLKAAGVQAIYVDNTITHNEPLWNLIKPGIGTYYEMIYTGKAGSILVLLVK